MKTQCFMKATQTNALIILLHLYNQTRTVSLYFFTKDFPMQLLRLAESVAKLVLREPGATFKKHSIQLYALTKTNDNINAKGGAMQISAVEMAGKK